MTTLTDANYMYAVCMSAFELQVCLSKKSLISNLFHCRIPALKT